MGVVPISQPISALQFVAVCTFFNCNTICILVIFLSALCCTCVVLVYGTIYLDSTQMHFHCDMLYTTTICSLNLYTLFKDPLYLTFSSTLVYVPSLSVLQMSITIKGSTQSVLLMLVIDQYHPVSSYNYFPYNQQDLQTY